MALHIRIGNFSGAIASNIYRKQDAPRYVLGHSIELGFLGMGLLLTPLTAWIYSWINTRRDALDDGRYDNMTVEESKALGDRAPDFHYSLWRNSHLSYHVISFHFRKEDGVTGNEGTIVFWSNNVTSSFVDAIIILCGNWERQGKLRVLLIQVYFLMTCKPQTSPRINRRWKGRGTGQIGRKAIKLEMTKD